MLQLLEIGDNAADTSHRFSTLALGDNTALEADLAEDRRAALEAAAESFDPLGLYNVEIERDLAASILQETFPDPAITLGISPVEYRHRISGEWIVRREWQATINDVHAFAAMPEKAVNEVIAAYRKATAAVRTTPQHRSLSADTFESLGRIDTATAPAFLELVEAKHGASDFLTVEPDGRVMLACGLIGPEEAFAIGCYVAEHVGGAMPAPQVVVERTGDTFKSYVVTADGERVKAGNCFTESEAMTMATVKAMGLRTTIAAAPVAAVTAA
jgi:hypothetical protein